MAVDSFLNLTKHALRLSRVKNLIIIIFTQYLAAIFLVLGMGSYLLVLQDLKFFSLVGSTVVIAASGYFINDYYDIKIDLINKPNKVIIGKNVKRRPVLVAHLILNTIGIALGIWVSIWIGCLNFICAFLLWFYSNQLKKLPFVGNFVVALMTSSTLLSLVLYYRSHEILLYMYASFAFGITLIREIIKDIEDMQGDAMYGGLTLPITIGLRKTKFIIYCLLTILVGVIASFLLLLKNQILFGYFTLLLIPLSIFVFRIAKADTKSNFSNLSSYSKWLILAGVLSMVLINH